MPYEEKPASRKQRIAWLVGVWIVGAFPMVALFFWSWVVGLIVFALALWASYDYLESGGFFETIDWVASGGGRLFGEWAKRRADRYRH